MCGCPSAFSCSIVLRNALTEFAQRLNKRIPERNRIRKKSRRALQAALCPNSFVCDIVTMLALNSGLRINAEVVYVGF